MNLGLDIGSTTVKLVILNKNKIIYKKYVRHFSNIKKSFIEIFEEVKDIIKGRNIKIAITGSSGIDLASVLEIDFIQEVIAGVKAVKKFIPDTDVAIELGGEDAKITYFRPNLEQRMNGTCAGGTGAFIDQMAILLKTDAAGLNELAKEYKTIYPIASRCGVFAKTDIQPLLNEGALKEDIAASIFQAVVNQTITALAQGRPMRGRIAFLGGPLYFLSELRNRFVEILNLKEEEIIFPDDSNYFVAIGAALAAADGKMITSDRLYENLQEVKKVKKTEKDILKPLFINKEEYLKFKKRHDKNKVQCIKLSDYEGKAYLGIDAGSTTTKIALISDNNELLYSFYTNNQGKPIESVKEALIDLYRVLPVNVEIVNSVVTGYGESLLKAAFKVDIGEIETIAHYKAANFFLPNTDFILDIGGQDMKSLKIKNNVIESIMLNEACSSGCGSFIETFAKSLNMEIKNFATLALKSKNPVNLGTRCTVFMNSKVKQVQKEGATIADISAGIAFSVVKNALYKVIRLKNISQLGERIVVQGGTFYNDAVLRSFEQIIGKEVVRPNISGIMGAYGAAIIAKEKYTSSYKSTLITLEELSNFNYTTSLTRCKACTNQCLLTINNFPSDRFISGNRCERGLGFVNKKQKAPNMYLYKYQRVFDYQSKRAAARGKIGVPRVLNIYEDYPFWHTFFTSLDFEVILSDHSSKKIYELGIETIPSESVCYPAKITHGHIKNLINKGVKTIFYPSIIYNIKESTNVNNCFNCPIVISYPETIKANIDEIADIEYLNPFLNINDSHKLFLNLKKTLKKYKITDRKLKNAIICSYKELEKYKQDVRCKGEETLSYMTKHNVKGILLAGRPYHIDPEINHGIPELISSFNLAVLSEDAICHLSEKPKNTQVVDQWVYQSRLYKAAEFIAQRSDIEIIQLNSFGCGIDSISNDQVAEILERYGKTCTAIKIDEISNLGAARIRIRSLLAATKENQKINQGIYKKYDFQPRVVFEKEMKDYTILVPQMSPIHFQFLQTAFKKSGFNMELLPDVDKEAISEGLKYVNNDSCYPSIIIIGQIMKAIKSGIYNIEKLAVIMSQTGGGCRATNYITFIRKALKDAGFPYIPVISLNALGMEKNPGFKLNPAVLNKLIIAIIYGDLLMKLLYQIRPYEKKVGSTNQLYEKWVLECNDSFDNLSFKKFKNIIYQMIDEFDNLPLNDITKPKVGIVGEILVKYHPTANNNIIDLLEHEGAEVIVPDLMGFFLYSLLNSKISYQENVGTFKRAFLSDLAIKIFEFYCQDMKKALNKSKRFTAPHSIHELSKLAEKHLSLCHQTGEGWFLTAEMVDYLKNGISNILCLQPFACLPNHITGKGMKKELKRVYPDSNIVAIDYDSDLSEVNQINRIKLMLSIAHEKILDKNLKS